MKAGFAPVVALIASYVVTAAFYLVCSYKSSKRR